MALTVNALVEISTIATDFKLCENISPHLLSVLGVN